MAISFVGSAENAAGNGASVSVTLPGGMQQDDLVIVAFNCADNDNLDHNLEMTTAGYTEIADLLSEDTRETNLAVFYKFMGATPDTTAVTTAIGGTDAANTVVVMVFRGVDTTTPLDVASTTATGINTMHPNPPSINTVTAGVWTVIAGASAHVVAATETYTFPTGYTTDKLEIGNLDTTGGHVGMGYRTNPADPEDPGVMTLSGVNSTAYSWAAVTMALRPAAESNDRRGVVTWAEFEVPNDPRRGVVTWAELEVPNEPRRAIVTWAELEVPDAPRRAIVTWAELEVPDAPAGDRRAVITWTELEVPNEPRRGIITWAELEVPNEPRRGIITWAELEVPEVGIEPPPPPAVGGRSRRKRIEHYNVLVDAEGRIVRPDRDEPEPEMPPPPPKRVRPRRPRGRWMVLPEPGVRWTSDEIALLIALTEEIWD